MRKLLNFSFFVFLLSHTNLLLIAQTTESYEDWNNKPKEIPNTESESEEKGNEPIVIDGLYERTISKERQPLAYEHLREADIFWQKRIWRVIDTRQKMNLPFIAEKDPLISIFNKIVSEHDDAYIFMDDEFKEQINCPTPINIGNSVWIGSGNLILKGAIIPDNSIIGANSLINKELKYKKSLYAGNPVVRLKENVNWEL